MLVIPQAPRPGSKYVPGVPCQHRTPRGSKLSRTIAGKYTGDIDARLKRGGHRGEGGRNEEEAVNDSGEHFSR